MSPAPLPAAPPGSPALAAFLRGIERRAFVFAQVQCGSDPVAEQALGRAMRAFRGTSALTPLSGWPAAFWALLLAQPELSGGDSDAPEFAHLSSGPRAALLLRMVGGLDFDHAAQVLGVGESTYRFALQRALQQLGDAGISYAELGALRERLHRQVKTLPEGRTAALAELRARALADVPEPEPPAVAPRNPWVRRALWLVFALLLAAFAATFLSPAPVLAPGDTEALPENAAPPPLPASGEAELVTHPDFAQLSSPEDEALAQDLALLSWLAAGEGELALPEAPGGEGAAAAENDDAP